MRTATAVQEVPRTPVPLKIWLNPAEAVDYLGLPSIAALYKAVRRGQVPCHRLGARRMRFKREELDRVLGGRR